MTRTKLWEIFQAGAESNAVLGNKLIEELLSPKKTVVFDVHAIRQAGEKIHFIKVLREQLNLGLVEAKNLSETGILNPNQNNEEIMKFLHNGKWVL